MLYSSGTTGQPKGILRPLGDTPAREMGPFGAAFAKFWDVRRGEIFVVLGFAVTTRPLVEVGLTLSFNGTAVVMERFDEEAGSSGDREISRNLRPQFVPTMFSMPAEAAA